MYTIEADNVNVALAKGIELLLDYGEEELSRNGPVLVSPRPVCTMYTNSANRVLRCPVRNANPFLHLFEALWMLAGHNDVDFPRQFNKRFNEYSDDGTTLNGAYGFRWKYYFGYDQVRAIIQELKENPHSRRCVLAMWDGKEDLLNQKSKDLPCNTHVYFRVREHKYLDMTVCNRSNDIIWGCYGANMVHFSILQEYMAAHLNVEIGNYYQMSNNFHAYTDVFSVENLRQMAESSKDHKFGVHHLFTAASVKLADDDLTAFFSRPGKWQSSWLFKGTVNPMLEAWEKHKEGNTKAAISHLRLYDTGAWTDAGIEWLERVQARKDGQHA